MFDFGPSNTSIKHRKMEKITINSMIEIVGTPKKHIEDTMQNVIKLIKENKKFELIKQKIAEPKEVSVPGAEQVKDVWSTYGEFEVNFENLEDIEKFCLDFMPSSIEILKPEKLQLKATDLEEFINDILQKLHQYDMVLKKISLAQRLQQKAISEKKDDPS